MKKNISGSANGNSIHLVLVILLALNLIVSIWGFFIKQDASVTLEKLRAGGEANYQAIIDFYQSSDYINQQTQSIQQALQGAGNPTPSAVDTTNTLPTASNDNIKDAVADILADSLVQGEEDARYLVIEYSDLECPFCKQHHNNGTIEAFVAAHDGEVKSVFRHFPLTSIHPNAQLAAEGAECAAELGDAEGFYDYIDNVFALSVLDKNNFIQAATDAGINQSRFTTCINANTYTSRVMDQLQEGQNLFGIRGTPGNVLVDTETGKFVVIAGAYPIDKFEQELANLKSSQ